MDLNNSPTVEKIQCWVTPNKKNEIMCDIASIKSPISYTTPVKQTGMKLMQMACQNNSGCFKVLPNHITPPSGLTKFVARNPFETDLTNRLHLSVISPTVFTKVSSPSSQEASVFSWNIEELAVIQPAKIEEFPIQQTHCTDPEVERKAQAAIDRFFKENQIIPSPWDNDDKNNCRKEDMQTPLRGFNDTTTTTSTKESLIFKKDAWTQTTLSLPPNLPPHVEEILKPYFTFTQEQNVESDEANSSGNSSLRRKLFVHDDDDDSHEDEMESSFSMTPMHSRSMVHCSPLQSGMFIHGTPLRGSSGSLQRNHGTPLAFDNMSPLNMSPIGEVADEMSYETIKSRARSAARLDFTTDMSIEISVSESVERTKEIHNNPPDNCWTEIKKPVNVKSSNREEQNNVVDMVMQFKNSTQFDEKENQPPNFNCDSLLKRPKFGTDVCKTHSSESCTSWPQNFTLSVTSAGQQSVFNSAQDTGYQTCSINNTTNNAESYATSVIKEKLHWDEQLLLPSEDEPRLSDWRENMKYMCSSTPSKFLRERINEEELIDKREQREKCRSR